MCCHIFSETHASGCFLLMPVEQGATREQVAPLGVVELVVAHQQRDAEQQREDQLDLLEERAAHAPIQEVEEERVQVLHALLEVAIGLRVGDRAGEEVGEQSSEYWYMGSTSESTVMQK